MSLRLDIILEARYHKSFMIGFKVTQTWVIMQPIRVGVRVRVRVRGLR